MKIDNSSTERVEEFKYLGTTLKDQNYIHEEIKSTLKLGNACYHSVQNLLSSSLLSKNLAGGKIEKNEMGGSCGTCGGGESCAQGVGGEARRKEAIWGTQT
jgi:hypothetical protein